MRSLIFDFDGLLLDTETPSFETWVEIYRDHGAVLAWDDYIHCVGSTRSVFDAASHLEKLVGRSLDRPSLNQRHLEAVRKRLETQAPCPGAVELLREAKAGKLTTAVASSSNRRWVEGNLVRLGIRGLVDVLVSREDVEKVKPAPDLFLKALGELGASPREAVVFEDSLNGIRAAHAAGLFCVAVPNPVTRGLSLQDADLLIPSLDAMPLGRILELAEKNPAR